jgi:hypothetical protein
VISSGVASQRDGLHAPAAFARLRRKEALPEVRDGLNRLERAILVALAALERERRGAGVPTAMLYGRVLESVDVGRAEFQAALERLIGRSVG